MFVQYLGYGIGHLGLQAWVVNWMINTGFDHDAALLPISKLRSLEASDLLVQSPWHGLIIDRLDRAGTKEQWSVHRTGWPFCTAVVKMGSMSSQLLDVAAGPHSYLATMPLIPQPPRACPRITLISVWPMVQCPVPPQRSVPSCGLLSAFSAVATLTTMFATSVSVSSVSTVTAPTSVSPSQSTVVQCSY